MQGALTPTAQPSEGVAVGRDPASVRERAVGRLLSLQDSEGWWKGELQTNVTMDAEDLLLREFLGIRNAEITARSAAWIGHDASVCRDGVFDKTIAAIRAAQQRGFRITTNTTFFTHDSPATVRRVLDFLNDELKVDQMMISPAYAYEKAPDQEHFLGVQQTRELFRAAFAGGRRKHWRLNHSPLFLDFLEGKVDFACTASGIPSYSLYGWQRPCYLMADGYASTYRELVETTDWESYGRGRDPRCANCMAHCGYEPTAMLATTRSVRQALRAVFSG